MEYQDGGPERVGKKWSIDIMCGSRNFLKWVGIGILKINHQETNREVEMLK